MDNHVVYQAVPIDLNEYFSSAGQSSLLPTFGGSRSNRDDDDNRKKLYLLGGLVVILILLLAIVLPIVHHHHKSERLHHFMTNAVGNDEHGEPRVLLKPNVKTHAINQEEHSSTNFVVPIDIDNVVNDDETKFWRLDYLGDDEGISDVVDYIQEENEAIHAELVHGHPVDGKVDGQYRYLEDEDDDDESFPDYYDIVELGEDDEDEEFEADGDAFAFGIKGDASPKLFEGEDDDTDLKAYGEEFGSEDSQDYDRIDDFYQGNSIDRTLVLNYDAEQQAMAH
jgi:hypothetical protein